MNYSNKYIFSQVLKTKVHYKKEKMKRNILITGATGLVGGYLLSRLINDDDYRISLIIRAPNICCAKERLRAVLKFFDLEDSVDRVHVYCGDLTVENLGLSIKDSKKLKLKLTDVFHSAAEISFNDNKNKGMTSHTNIVGTENILNFCGTQVSFFYVSTAYVAGDYSGEFSESDLDVGQNFKNDYERSKYLAEKKVRKFFSSRPEMLTVLRPSIVIGEYRDGKTFQFESFYNVLYLLYRFSKRHGEKTLSFRYDPDATQNYIPVDRLANMIEEIIRKKECHGNTYNLVDNNPLKNSQLAKLFKQILDINILNMDPSKSTNPFDRLFAKRAGNYMPYLQSEPKFKCLNSNRLKSSKTNMSFNVKYLARLLNFCLKTNWGKNLIYCR